MDCCFIFSGQGSHRPGMGINLYEHSSIAKSKIDLADSVLGYKISQIMFDDNLIGGFNELKEHFVNEGKINFKGELV